MFISKKMPAKSNSKKSKEESEVEESEEERSEKEESEASSEESEEEDESSTKKEKKISASGEKRHKNRFNFNGKEGDTTRWKKRIKPALFKRAVSTVSDDIKHVFQVAAYAYGGGTDKSWDKKHAKAYLAQVLDRLDKLSQYQRFKPKNKANSKKNSTNELKRNLFLFQNITDWINQTNMGSGLTSLMCHMKKNESKSKNPKRKDFLPDIPAFIERANKNLETETTFEEIFDLNFTHMAGTPDMTFIEGEDVSSDEYHFTASKSGNGVSKNDERLNRIMAIRNAYVNAYNEEEHDKDLPAKLMELTLEDANNLVVPQRAIITTESGEELNVADIFNYPITTVDGAEHKVAAITSSMSTTIITLMGNANRIHDKKQTGLLHYDLFSKFFNGSDETYAPGANVGFWLNNTNQNFGISKKATDKKSLTDAINKEFKDADKKVVSNIVKRMMHFRGGDSLTAFGIIEKGKKGKKVKEEEEEEEEDDEEEGGKKKTEKRIGFKMKGKKGESYGIRTFAATQLIHLYRIPTLFLSEETRALTDETTDEFKTLSDKLSAVQRHLTSINDVYTAYSTKSRTDKANKKKKEEKARKKEKESSSKTKRRKIKLEKLD
jgi:hypothetical protein